LPGIRFFEGDAACFSTDFKAYRNLNLESPNVRKLTGEPAMRIKRVWRTILTVFWMLCSYAALGQDANVNRLGPSPNSMGATQWIKSGSLSVVPGQLSVPLSEDQDGFLDLLQVSANYQSMYSQITLGDRDVATISVLLAGMGTVYVSLSRVENNPNGDYVFRRQEITLSSTPRRVTFVDFTKPGDQMHVALEISGIDVGETIYAGGARAYVTNLVEQPDDLTKLTWIKSVNLTRQNPMALSSNSIVSRQDDIDGVLTKLTSSSAGGYIYAPLATGAGRDSTTSIMLAGNGFITVSIVPLTNNTLGAAYPGQTYPLTLTALPKRSFLNQFEKPNDGKIAVLLISGIDSGETAYVGGVRALSNRVASPNNLNVFSATGWTKSSALTVTPNFITITTTVDSDGKLDKLVATSLNQSIFTAINPLADGETVNVKIWLAGTGTVSINLSPIENNANGNTYITSSPISLTAAGQFYEFDHFTKPVDGRTAAFSISAMDTGETVYAGGLRTYHPPIVFDEDYGTVTSFLLPSDRGDPGLLCREGVFTDAQFQLPRWTCLHAKRLATSPASIQIPTNLPPGGPRKAVLFYVKDTDAALAPGNPNPRAELSNPIINGFPFNTLDPNDGDNRILSFEVGRTYYLKTSYYLPATETFPNNINYGEVAWQLHMVCDDSSASPQQILYRSQSLDRFIWNWTWDSTFRNKLNYNDPSDPGGCFAPGVFLQPKGDSGAQPLPAKGNWVDVEVIWKPDYADANSKGRLITRINGTSIVSQTSHSTTLNSHIPFDYSGTKPGKPDVAIAAYFQLGIYRYGINVNLAPCVAPCQYLNSNSGPDGITRQIYWGPTTITTDPLAP
jgi:hypothetical protein